MRGYAQSKEAVCSVIFLSCFFASAADFHHLEVLEGPNIPIIFYSPNQMYCLCVASNYLCGIFSCIE